MPGRILIFDAEYTLLGDMTAENGYQNLFVQGGGLDFSGTAKFCMNMALRRKRL